MTKQEKLKIKKIIDDLYSFGEDLELEEGSEAADTLYGGSWSGFPGIYKGIIGELEELVK